MHTRSICERLDLIAETMQKLSFMRSSTERETLRLGRLSEELKSMAVSLKGSSSHPPRPSETLESELRKLLDVDGSRDLTAEELRCVQFMPPLILYFKGQGR